MAALDVDTRTASETRADTDTNPTPESLFEPSPHGLKSDVPQEAGECGAAHAPSDARLIASVVTPPCDECHRTTPSHTSKTCGDS